MLEFAGVGPGVLGRLPGQEIRHGGPCATPVKSCMESPKTGQVRGQRLRIANRNDQQPNLRHHCRRSGAGIPRRRSCGLVWLMTSDIDIYRSAKPLIDEQGEDAPLDRASREACAAHASGGDDPCGALA